MFNLAIGGLGILTALGALAIGAQAATREEPPATAAKSEGVHQAPKARVEVPAKPAPVKNRVLTGRVLDIDGKPEEGSTVVAGLSDTGEPNHSLLTTDAEGRFAWPIPDGDVSIQVTAHHADFAPHSWSRYFTADKRVDPIELSLGVAEPATAVLVDAEGKPIVGAKLRVDMFANRTEERQADGRGSTTMICYDTVPHEILSGTPLATLFEATTDAEGAFTLKSVPWPYLKLRLTTANGSVMRATSEAKGVAKDEPGCDLEGFVLIRTTVPVRLVAAPTARVAGKITTRMPGEKLGRLKVFIQESKAGGAIGRGNINIPVVPVGEDGQFEIVNLDEGVVNVMVHGDGSTERWTFRAGKDIPLIPGKTSEVAIELIPGVVAEGTVVDEAGKPVEGAMVGAYGPMHPRSGAATRSETTDAKGRYRHRVPPGENYFYVMGSGDRFRPYKEEGSSRTVPIPGGVATFTLPPIAVETTVPLHGKVVDASGKPIVGVTILGLGQQAVFMKAAGATQKPVGVTDARGEFRIAPDSLTAPPNKPSILRLRRKGGKEIEVQITPDADGAVTIELPDSD